MEKPIIIELLEKKFGNQIQKNTSKSNSSRSIYVIKEKDRRQAKSDLQDILVKNKISFEDVFMRSYSSSINVDLVKIGDHSFVFVYKPVGGAAGAGAEQTAIAECAQSIYNAVAQELGHDITPGDVQQNAKKFTKFFDIDRPLEKVLNSLTPDWEESSAIIANQIRKDLRGKKYIFHRGSKFVDMIERKFKELNRKEEISFSNINKWTPADIWAQEIHSYTIHSQKIQQCKNLKELNQYLKEQIQKKTLIGISLKKVKGTTKKSEHNVGKPNNRNKYKVKDIIISTGGNIFSSKDIYITGISPENNTFKIQFRTFSTFSSWQGEIKGKNANMGKVGYGPINMVLNEIKIGTLEDPKKLRTLILKNDINVVDTMYRWKSDLLGNKKIDYGTFLKEYKKKPDDWKMSMFYGLQLAWKLNKYHNKKNDFLTGLFAYASSSTELSAPYYKYS